jgi:Protein of unknown function (DUF3179)
MRTSPVRRQHRIALARGGMFGALVLIAAACGESPTTNRVGEIICDLDNDLLVASLAPNAIPAISGPTMVDPDDVSVDYMFDSDRVAGVVINGEARAYPHNIMWHHEIINDVIDGVLVSVTLCPLTGSAMAFSPEIDGRTLDLGVSGLLFANNLVMYDRLTDEVYGPQLAVAGSCQGFRGSSLTLMPMQEMSWGRWKELYPDTKVVSGDTGFARNYRNYPYGNYDNINSTDLLFGMPVDDSRPIKERVLAIRSGDAGRGYPYGELALVGPRAAVNEVVSGIPTVVFYEVINGQAALAFDARVNGQTLTFEVDSTGAWVDLETGSIWELDGTAIAGPMVGERLRTREDAYTVFWFAWRHFQPNGQMFSAS